MARKAEKLADLFSQVVQGSLTLAALDEAGGISLTPTQMGALRYLWRHAEVTICSLAEGLGVSQPAGTRLVDRLVERGLVARSNPAKGGDRRVKRLRLTTKGSEVLRRFRQAREARLEEVVGRMDAGSREALLSGLVAFLAAALRDGESVRLTCLRCGLEHQRDCPVNLAHLALFGREVTVT